MIDPLTKCDIHMHKLTQISDFTNRAQHFDFSTNNYASANVAFLHPLWMKFSVYTK